MGVFPEYGNLGARILYIRRYVLSISFLIAPFFINRRLNIPVFFGAYSLATGLILASVFWHAFPVTIVEGLGLTMFKIISDYVVWVSCLHRPTFCSLIGTF